jgi:triosephosphate isomerase
LRVSFLSLSFLFPFSLLLALGMLLVSYKTYREATGDAAVGLTRQAVAALHTFTAQTTESGGAAPRLVVCPQLVDLRLVVTTACEGVASAWAQHVDGEERGRATGWCPAEVAREAGATGTMLNHAEHKLDPDQLQRTVQQCHRAGLEVLVWANSLDEVEALLASLGDDDRPEWIGYEPEELIASADTSVAKARPELIVSVVELVRRLTNGRTKGTTPMRCWAARGDRMCTHCGLHAVLVGAGVKDQHDVRAALRLGAHGVGAASGFVRAAQPSDVLLDLLTGFSVTTES